MDLLAELHADIETRVGAMRAECPDWPCAKGCDSCCRQLADVPRLTAAEWQLLRAGLAALPAEMRQEIGRAIMSLKANPVRPVVCPMLELGTGACPVYLQRPVACRTYGFYMQRGVGLFCRGIETEVAEGGMDEVVWGNQDSVDRRLAALGETRALTEWFEAGEA